MADGKVKIDFDPIVKYFSTLTQDLMIAWLALVLGVIILIVGFVI
jgi:hypothetical protein